MRCDGCKHWVEVPEEWEALAAGFRECAAIRTRWKIADEASDHLANDRTHELEPLDDAESKWLAARIAALKTARAYVQDGSEYRAELYTAPDFFCALFTPA